MTIFMPPLSVYQTNTRFTSNQNMNRAARVRKGKTDAATDEIATRGTSADPNTPAENKAARKWSKKARKPITTTKKVP